MEKFIQFGKNAAHWTHQTTAPLFLILACLPAVFLFWYINVILDRSFLKLGEQIYREGLFITIRDIWSPYFFGSIAAWKMFAIFSAFQLLLMRFLPGKTFYGPITPASNVPNGLTNSMIVAAKENMVLTRPSTVKKFLIKLSLLSFNLGFIYV